MGERPGMKSGELLLSLLILASIAGVVIAALLPGPDPSLIMAVTEDHENSHQSRSPLDILSEGCSPLIYGNLPRQSFSGDTTVLHMDLDVAAFTVTQANLAITRLLGRCGMILHHTNRRPDGGLTFVASLPDGKPLRLELKAAR